MLSQGEYLWAWVVYLVGVIAVIGCVVWASWSLRSRELRTLLWLVPTSVLFVPAYTTPDSDYLSPAWLISLADLLIQGPQAFWRTGFFWLVPLVIALSLSILYFIWLWLRANKR